VIVKYAYCSLGSVIHVYVIIASELQPNFNRSGQYGVTFHHAGMEPFWWPRSKLVVTRSAQCLTRRVQIQDRNFRAIRHRNRTISHAHHLESKEKTRDFALGPTVWAAGCFAFGKDKHMRTMFSRLLFAITIFAMAGTASAGIILSIGIAPPPLPIYEQPLCPGDGYIWTPGYWAYGDDGFFWVPGTWVLIPEPGFLWTPGYWGWGDGIFIFHEGYWGPNVGFYGGINYGFGYIGVGYAGGYWNHGAFFYNRSVNHISHVTNVYNKTVINNITVNNVSYNGGTGGIAAHPNSEEEAAMHERHIAPSSVQTQHLQAASANRQLYESVNHGRPPIAATSKPGEFKGHGVVRAKAAAKSYAPPTARAAAISRNGAAPTSARNKTAAHTSSPVHPDDLPAISHSAGSNAGNSKQEKQYQQQQEKLFAKQQQERQKLQQKQEQEHNKLAQSRRNQQKQQQLEQRHQQQTQQLQQRHSNEQQKLQSRQPQARPSPRR
jgi:hypothetical protein